MRTGIRAIKLPINLVTCNYVWALVMHTTKQLLQVIQITTQD